AAQRVHSSSKLKVGSRNGQRTFSGGQGESRIFRMKGQTDVDSAALAAKIARLVEERGWNMEDLARISNLNRHTVRQIMQEGNRRLRNATVSACARALGLTVSDLRNLPLDRLLPRMNGR